MGAASKVPWLALARMEAFSDLQGIARISSGKVSKFKDPTSSEPSFRADEDLRLRVQLHRRSCSRVVFEVRLSSVGQMATLSYSGCGLRMSGNHGDEGVLDLVATTDEKETPLSFRFRPDIGPWAWDEAERDKYRKEFEAAPGWSSSWIRVSLDVSPDQIRVWLQGRFIAGAKSRPGKPDVSLSLSRGVVFRAIRIVPLASSRFVPLDITPWANCKGTDPGSLGDGFAFPADRLSAEGMVRVRGVPFHVELGSGRADNIDLGRTAYRGKLPYIHCDAMTVDPCRALLRVPKAHYDRLHIICTSDTSEGDLPVGSVRMIKTGRGHASTSEFSAPRWDEVRAGPKGFAVGTMLKATHRSGKPGRLWLVSVSLNPGEFLEFLNDETDHLEIDLTKKVALDDESFPRPAGPASAVHIFAATLELAPARMVPRWEGIGPVYEEPAVPKLRIDLESQRADEQRLTLRLEIVDPYGLASSAAEDVVLGPHRTVTMVKELAQEVFGKFDLRVRLETPDGGRFVEHRTSFAYLPKDRRMATRDSPFGMWCFFEVHNGLPPEWAAPLMRMAGVRWTLPGFLLSKGEEENARRLAVLERNKIGLNCGNVCCIANTCCESPGDPEEMLRKMQKMPRMDSWMVFWETSLSSRHRGSFPPELLGREPLELTEEERRHLDNCWKAGVGYSKLVREQFPGTKLIFGNGFPAFIGAMIRRGYPKEYLDAFGLDFDLFMSMPERQPGPLYAPFSGIYVLKALQRIYGYDEFPLYLTEAIYAPVAPGWLTERQQADCYVRTHLLALASGVVFFGMCTSPYDPGDEYFYSHYGPIGLLHRPPELNPRESFCAYSTMTRILDQASYDRMLPTSSGSVFALRFDRKRGGPVHVLWTIRGSRRAMLRCVGAKRPVITDMFGNRHRPRTRSGLIQFDITSSPAYLEGIDHVADVALGDPEHEVDSPGCRILAGFEDLSRWKVDARPVEELEALTLSVPYRRVDLDLASAHQSEGRGPVLRVGLPKHSQHHPLEIGYSQLLWAGPEAIIPESASTIGGWIRGNSSWGRVLFCLEDAGGARLVSVRADSYIDFDGWRYVGVGLPHGPREMQVDRIGFHPWARSTAEDPRYPLRLKGLILEARSHVIHASKLRPVQDRFYYVGQITLDRG